ncbi:Flp pilus assembly protein TadG OS=Streptomyces violarus OX=67380 GN=FHS41_002546 PE=4 SV=1 [Streptomyces violarus]
MAYVRRERDRGQVAIEYLGFLPILLLVAMAAVQLGLIAYTAQQAGTAAGRGRVARRSSRAAPNRPARPRSAAGWPTKPTVPRRREAMRSRSPPPSTSRPRPGLDFDPARKTATMPLDH